jgi:VWFA-related protein
MTRRVGGHWFSRQICLCFLAAAAARSLTSAAQENAPQAVPLPAGAAVAPGLVTLNVLAQDQTGNPVSGLQAKDLTVVDNGQPRTLRNFREVDARQNPEATHVLLVLDMINTGFNEIAWEREQVTDFLKQDGGKLAHPVSIAAMTDRGVKMMQGSSQDGAALVEGMGKLQTELRDLTRASGFWGATERLSMSLDQLGQIAAVESRLPGRKMVVVISPGWPQLPGAGSEEDAKQRKWVFGVIVQFTNALRENGIVLYCLDPYILGRTNPEFYKGYLKGVKRYSNAEYPNIALQVLAEHSGGRTLTQGHDVMGEIKRAMRDAGTYYEVSFEEPTADTPNEYHEVQVKVERPDVTARTASIYYANAQATGGKTTSPTHATSPR